MKKRLKKPQIQKLVWKFIYEFRDKAVKQMGGKIDFIIIYGSAVRHEFVPGKSDVDIVFQVFNKEDKDFVLKKATEIFWKTAEKYPDLQFDKSLSVSNTKRRNGITQIFQKIEKTSFLFVPVFVFAGGEINWQKGELHSDDPVVKFGQHFLIPQHTVFLRFKQEGEILYGRDIRKSIKVRLTLTDRLRIGFAPQLMCFFGFFISPLMPKKATSYAVKALLYQVDSLITALDEYKNIARYDKISKNQKLLLEEFTDHLQKIVFIKLDYAKGTLRPVDFRLFTDAVKIKWGEKKLNYPETVWFCFKAWFFIVRLNIRSVLLLFLRIFTGRKR